MPEPAPWCLIFSDGTGQRGVPAQEVGDPQAGHVRNTNIYQMYAASDGRPGLTLRMGTDQEQNLAAGGRAGQGLEGLDERIPLADRPHLVAVLPLARKLELPVAAHRMAESQQHARMSALGFAYP